MQDGTPKAFRTLLPESAERLISILYFLKGLDTFEFPNSVFFPSIQKFIFGPQKLRLFFLNLVSLDFNFLLMKSPVLPEKLFFF